MIGGYFNLSYGVGRRGEVLQELCDEYRLTIINGDGDAHQEDRWTFRSSAGNLCRIDYILVSNNLTSYDVRCDRSIDLGSDHRCVSVRVVFQRQRHQWQRKKRIMKE